AVLGAGGAALLPLRHGGDTPVTGGAGHAGLEVGGHPRAGDEGGDGAVAQCLVPLVAPAGDVGDQLLVDELLEQLGVPLRALVGEVDGDGGVLHRVGLAAGLPDEAGGEARVAGV